MLTALARERARLLLGATYPLLIGSERVDPGGKTMPSFNPAHPTEIVGDVRCGHPAGRAG